MVPSPEINSQKTNPKIRAIVLDMDGLMVNTEDLYDVVGERLLKRRGQTFTLELKRKMMGLKAEDAFHVMRNEHGLDDSIETLARESKQIFAEILPDRLELMEGMSELLAFAENRMFPIGVATSSTREFAHRVLGHFDLIPRLRFILTAEDVKQGKPHPEIYLAAAHRHGVPPQQMLALEDSVIGSRAAAAAEAYTVAVPGPHSRNGDFSHTDLIVETVHAPAVLELLL